MIIIITTIYGAIRGRTQRGLRVQTPRNEFVTVKKPNILLYAHIILLLLGVCGSLIVTFAAIKLPRPGQKFGSRFLLHAHRHRNQRWYLYRSQGQTRREGWWWGADNTAALK